MAKSKRKSHPRQVAQFFKWGDYTQQGMHFIAAAGVAITAGFWAGPLIFAGCAAAAGVVALARTKLSDTIIDKIFTKRKIKTDDSTGLYDAIKDFTAKIGLKQKPELYDFEINKEALGKQSDSLSTPAQVQRVFNAATSGLKKPTLIVSEPLLRALQPQETRAMIGHEFSHLGANHLKLSLVSGWLQATTMFTAMFGFGKAIMSEGKLTGILSMAGSMAIAYIGSKMMPKQEDRYTRDGTPRPGVQRTQLAILAAQETLSVGILAISNPATILTAFAIEHGLFWTTNLINKSLSRCHEFQADRGAVTLGANPLALVTTLRKIERSLQLNEPALAKAHNWREGPFYMRAFKKAASFLYTHPDTQQRCHRLTKMAARQGYDEKEIAEALSGKIDETNLLLPPIEFLKTDFFYDDRETPPAIKDKKETLAIKFEKELSPVRKQHKQDSDSDLFLLYQTGGG